MPKRPMVPGIVTHDPYRRWTAFYDRVFEPMNRGLRLIGLRMVRPRAGMAVLDVGCGTGAHLELYRRFGCRLHGVDISPSMLAAARTRLGSDADLRLDNAVGLTYPDASFDLVMAMLALHEMNPEVRLDVLREMDRVLIDNGKMLLIDFQPGPLRPLRGWLTKAIILLAESVVGGDHFRNFRQFMSGGGLPVLVEKSSLTIDRMQVAGGGPLILMLLKRPQ